MNSFEDCIIFLPTRGRVNNQVTLKLLPDSILRQVVIACHPGEEDELQKIWGEKIIGVIPVSGSHIGEVRQKCIDSSDRDYIIFVDDSLNFHVRSESEKGIKTKYPLKGLTSKHFSQKSIEKHLENMFNWLAIGLKHGDYGMVGISRRPSNAFNLDFELKENERVCSFWGINRKLFNSLPNSPKFSDMQLKEDFYIVLHFLTNGIKTITSYKYAYDRVGGANSKGGCSIYRNIENSNKSAIKLHEHFPDFVKIREKSVKSWNGEFKELVKAIDVTVYCQKAYESSRNS